MVIPLLSLMTFFNLHGRFLRLFGVKDLFYQPGPHDPETLEGRNVISGARNRPRQRDYLASPTPSSSGNSNTRDLLLQKYRGRQEDIRHSSLPTATANILNLDDQGGALSLKSADGKLSRLWAGGSPPVPRVSSRRFGNYDNQDGMGSSSVQGIWNRIPDSK